MSNGNLNWIANFIWGIADDVLRNVSVRGKYRDVILPMTVIRRLDAVLEPTKQAVVGMKKNLDKARIANQDAALRQASSDAEHDICTACPEYTRRKGDNGRGARLDSRHLGGFASVALIVGDSALAEALKRLPGMGPGEMPTVGRSPVLSAGHQTERLPRRKGKRGQNSSAARGGESGRHTACACYMEPPPVNGYTKARTP